MLKEAHASRTGTQCNINASTGEMLVLYNPDIASELSC